MEVHGYTVIFVMKVNFVACIVLPRLCVITALRSQIADNILKRQFNPDAPNKAWVIDITYVRTHEGFCT